MKKTVPILVLIALFASAAWYSLVKQPDPVHEMAPPALPPEPVSAQTEAPVEQAVTELPSTLPVTLPEPLPELAESDPVVIGSLNEIAGADTLDGLLVKDQLISRAVAAVDSLTSRQVPGQVNPVRAARGKFIVDMENGKPVLSERNFARYDDYVNLLASLDSDGMAALYRRYAPLLQQAWEQNGGEGAFEHRLAGVIDNLLETPDVTGPVYLKKPEAFYLYEDPQLEALTAGQKILLRMGSDNAAVVKQKLAELKAVIGAS